jgi:protein TonB
MAKPLQAEDVTPSTSLQFAHFGVLDAGRQSKASVFTSVTINVVIVLVAIVLGLAAKKISDSHPRMTVLVAPSIPKPPPPEIVKPQIIAKPAPKIAPAPPKQVIAPAAPAVVNLARPQAASVVNNSPHPSAVALGRSDNPIAPSDRPATSAVNLGQRGLAGMPASNSGGGPNAAQVNLGSGSPGGSALSGNGTRAIQGVKLGVAGGTGPNNATGRVAGPVNLGVAVPPAIPRTQGVATAAVRSGPKVVFKPRPEYTAEARAMHLEGTVSVRLRVSAAGSVEVLGVSTGLGHGLDQAAENAVRSTRFQPALDAAGRPIDWEGVVNVAFQLAS